MDAVENVHQLTLVLVDSLDLERNWDEESVFLCV